MRGYIAIAGLLLFLGVGSFSSFGSDLIQVRATMIPVKGKQVEGLSQGELAALVRDAEKQQGGGAALLMEGSAVVRPGSWMTAKKVHEFWYATAFEKARLMKSKSDTRSYSIPVTEEIEKGGNSGDSKLCDFASLKRSWDCRETETNPSPGWNNCGGGNYRK